MSIGFPTHHHGHLTLEELHSLAQRAGIPDPGGIPFSALVAAMALEESSGNPDARGDRGVGGGSSGLLQVNAAAWPEVHAQVERTIRERRASPSARAMAQIILAKPVLEDASKSAVAASTALNARGFHVDTNTVLQLVDAAWQGGGPKVEAWAKKTRTGDPGEINAAYSPGRSQRILSSVRVLTGGMNDVLAIVSIVVLGGILLFALSNWSRE